jgi:hypothetical protein
MSFARASLLWLAGVSALAGCRAYSTTVELPVDCSATDAYDFMSIDPFDTGESPPWFGAGDALCSDGGGVYDPTPPIMAIEGGRCGSDAALVLRSSGCNDWGALYGDYNFAPKDASAWEGISFWARAPGETAKGFTLVLGDKNTSTPTMSVPVTNCKDYGDAGVSSGGGVPVTTDSTGNIISGGTTGPQPPPDACGQSYNAVFTVTTDWRFYTIPFTAFTQPASPNRVPNAALTETGNVPGTGLLTSALMNLTFRMSKESRAELWLDDLSFYRAKGWSGWPPNGGAAADAAQP